MKRIIIGAEIIDPSQGLAERGDLIIQDGVVSDILPRGDGSSPLPQSLVEGADTIDAHGLWLVPGLVDIHVHLREPGLECQETISSGAASALAGGFTSVCCMPDTEPVVDNKCVVAFIKQQAEAARGARVFPVGALTKGQGGSEMSPLAELASSGCVAFADEPEPVGDLSLLRRALEWSRHLNKPFFAHLEAKDLTRKGCMNESPLSARLGLIGLPVVAETIMVSRYIELSMLTGAAVHLCQVSSARSVELIRRAKEEGLNITAEVSAHHLSLTEEDVGDYRTDCKVYPPLRTSEDVDVLRQALAEGIIDVIASDHSPRDIDTKAVTFADAARGIIGLETTLPVILDLVARSKLSISQAVASLSGNPARICHLPVGSLRRGSPADITLIDPRKEWQLDVEVIRSKSKNTPWRGCKMIGQAVKTLIGGELAADSS